MFIARSAIAFIFAYLVLAVPTYILPYFGSNSTLVNAFSAAMGLGPTPQWWAHVWFLTMLVILGWMRGRVVARGYLPIFPMLAGIFDMTPGLSLIPMLPTLFHLLSVIVGALGKSSTAEGDIEVGADPVASRVGGNAAVATAVATILAISGSVLFVATGARAAKAMQRTFVVPAAPPTVPLKKVELQSTKVETPPIASAPAPLALAESSSAPKLETEAPPRHAAKPVRQAHHASSPPARPPESKNVAPEKPQMRYIRINE